MVALLQKRYMGKAYQLIGRNQLTFPHPHHSGLAGVLTLLALRA